MYPPESNFCAEVLTYMPDKLFWLTSMLVEERRCILGLPLRVDDQYGLTPKSKRSRAMDGTADIGDRLVPRWWTPLADPEISSPLIGM